MSVSATTNGVRPGVCLSTAKPSNPFIGQVIYMSDTDETAVWEGTYWEGLNRSRDRNVVINGAMQVAQRGTSFTFGTGSGTRRFAADRFDTEDYTWSAGSNITISNDTSVVPTGFRASYKVATGATGLTFASGGFLQIRTRIEGYNMQPHHSKMMTLSFWVRSSVTGTYNLFLENGNWGASTTTRAYAPEYTINSANTWEKKTIAVDMSSATSSGTWNTTNGIGLGISWVLGAHSDRTGDSYKSGWTTYSALHGKTSTSINWATNANATFNLTGVQLEAGSVATPFEFESHETTLRKCMRYYEKSYNQSVAPGTSSLPSAFQSASGNANIPGMRFLVPKRGDATVSIWHWNGTADQVYRQTDAAAISVSSISSPGEMGPREIIIASSSANNGYVFHWVAAAEL